MSNLGGYQWMTCAAKKVGGPANFILLVATSGAAICKGGELLVKKLYKEILKQHYYKSGRNQRENVYEVCVEGVSNEGLLFVVGDKIKVLEFANDAVLIEKIGDQNNPYFISKELLKNITTESD